MVSDRLLDTLSRALLNQKDHAASASCATNLGRPGSMPPGHRDEFVDKRRGNARSVGTPQLPFFAYQSLYVVPLLACECLLHRLRDTRDLCKVANDMFVAIDVLLEHLPVVDARL